jgi:hypothetical protein
MDWLAILNASMAELVCGWYENSAAQMDANDVENYGPEEKWSAPLEKTCFGQITSMSLVRDDHTGFRKPGDDNGKALTKSS